MFRDGKQNSFLNSNVSYFYCQVQRWQLNHFWSHYRRFHISTSKLRDNYSLDRKGVYMKIFKILFSPGGGWGPPHSTSAIKNNWPNRPISPKKNSPKVEIPPLNCRTTPPRPGTFKAWQLLGSDAGGRDRGLPLEETKISHPISQNKDLKNGLFQFLTLPISICRTTPQRWGTLWTSRLLWSDPGGCPEGFQLKAVRYSHIWPHSRSLKRRHFPPRVVNVAEKWNHLDKKFLPPSCCIIIPSNCPCQQNWPEWPLWPI